jgi:CRISPR/Cas system-associated exonuclease Cas4 (RecB family)
MKLTVQQISDYKKCPAYYQFKYSHGIPEEESLPQQVSNKVHRVVYFFFFQVMNQYIPKLDALKSKWESLWFQGMDPMQYILTPRNEKLETGQKAVPLIENFYNSNCLSPGMPLAIDQEYTVQIGDHEVSGKLEVVRELQDGPRRVIEISSYKTGSQVPIQWNVDWDFSLTMQSYAFRNLYSAKEQRLLQHYLRSNRMFYTHRSPDHYERVKATIDSIAEALSRNIFYPRETFLCSSCDYKNYCTIWK